MNNAYFSPVYAPLVGIAVGAVLALRMSGPEQNLPILWASCLGMGALGGFAVFLLDPKRSYANERSSGVVGRVLAISGFLVSIIPILGVVLCSISLLVNWMARDWAWKLTIVGLVVAIASTVIIMGGLDNGYVADALDEFFLNL